MLTFHFKTILSKVGKYAVVSNSCMIIVKSIKFEKRHIHTVSYILQYVNFTELCKKCKS